MEGRKGVVTCCLHLLFRRGGGGRRRRSGGDFGMVFNRSDGSVGEGRGRRQR